jgi:acyl-CoA thioester hydrolase
MSNASPSSADMRPQPLPRHHFPRFQTIATRWMDNDVYGHVNNVVHYSFFDTAVNRYLIEAGALDIHGGAVIGLVVQSQCHYFAPLAFPQQVHAGLRVAQRGRSSVHYELALFADDAEAAAAVGRFVHVYVERTSRRPVALPDSLLAALAPLETTE